MQIALAIIPYEHKVLIVQRKKLDIAVPTLSWAFPGGKVNPGETTEQAVIREVDEETQLHVVINQRLCNRTIPHTEIFAHYFLCSLRNQSTPEVRLNRTELTSFAWLSGTEALARFTSDVAEPVVAFLQRLK